MKVIYKAGPCKNKRCCPGGDTHLQVVELRGGIRFKRGGAAVEMEKGAAVKLIADHPGMFCEAGKSLSKKSVLEPKK